jgi:hypothetical protein
MRFGITHGKVMSGSHLRCDYHIDVQRETKVYKIRKL